jgi:predicted ATP-dependent endonuclease of OLD family
MISENRLKYGLSRRVSTAPPPDKDCQTMLTSIEQDGQTLHLRTRTSLNLFDIDSVSLIIGPNGAGKTRFLQATIEKFAPRPRPSFPVECRLLFDYMPRYDQAGLDDWGLIYFNPVPYRPRFNQQKNFIDASAAKAKNIFQLLDYSDILEGFDLRVELTASLRVDFRKISELFATALIENKKFQTNPNKFSTELLELRNLRQHLASLSDFDANHDDVNNIEKKYKNLMKVLARDLLDDFKRSAALIDTVDGWLLTAVFAVVQHMVKLRKYSIQQIIAFATMHIPSEWIGASKFSPRYVTESNELLSETLELLRDHDFASDERVEGSYFYAFDLENDRDRFESSPALPIFNVTLPGMSSGQEAIFNQVISIYEAIQASEGKSNLLIMIDEGDAFLHLAWQRKYIWQINNFLKRCKDEFSVHNMQLIIASHSPLLTSDMPREFVCDLPKREDNFSLEHTTMRLQHPANDELFNNEALLPPPSFAAPLYAILNLAFDASTIGEFATRRINATIKNLKAGRLTERDQYLISIVDDPIIKRELKAMAPNEVGV